MNNDILLSLKNVSFGYNDEDVLCDINLNIKRGEFIGIVGLNGSGKSTLLKLILGVNKPTSGEVLLDGKDLTKWEAAGKDGGSAKWAIKDGTMVVVPGSGSIRTKEYFGDCQLHIEFKTPIPGKDNTLQMKGNSGIMLQSRYEVQVLDCEDNPTYVNGWVGSVYKQSAPLANAFTKTNEWQVYDIYWKAPRFGTNDELESPAMITVVLNGIVVQNNYVLKGNTPYTGLPKYVAHGRMPLSLQDHGVEVAFRNIWIRDL